MANLRQSPRTPFKVRIRIEHPLHGEMLLFTKDMSEGGIFVLLDAESSPPLKVGERVLGQVQGMPIEAPIVPMDVVRIAPTGFGLKYAKD